MHAVMYGLRRLFTLKFVPTNVGLDGCAKYPEDISDVCSLVENVIDIFV